tara:strand:+ start:15378 stop:15950 length:573 start_codon:yes stop_codon:yes gene_type:complete
MSVDIGTTTDSRTTLKTYFQTGDNPTEIQFGNLINGSLNLNDGGVIKGNVTFSSASLHLSHSSITSSGNFYFESASVGINYINITEKASVDAAAITVSGRRFTVKNKLQAALNGSHSIGVVITNNEVAEGDIVLGQFVGGVGSTATEIHESCSLTTFTTGSGTFTMKIHNISNAPILDNSNYTASFIVIK